NLLLRAKGRETFESGVGFTVVGAAVSRSIATGPKLQQFKENEAWHVRVIQEGLGRHAASALIQFDSGNGIVLGILPGLIGTIVVDNGRVLSVSYVPSRKSHRYPDYKYNADAIKKRHAFVAAAARYGAFRIEPSTAAE